MLETIGGRAYFQSLVDTNGLTNLILVAGRTSFSQIRSIRGLNDNIMIQGILRASFLSEVERKKIKGSSYNKRR